MGEEADDELDRAMGMETYFTEELKYREAELSGKSDRKVLSIAIKCGPKLNEVTEFFPAYDVALKLFNNKWVPTEKQRKAIINVVAFYKTKKDFL